MRLRFVFLIKTLGLSTPVIITSLVQCLWWHRPVCAVPVLLGWLVGWLVGLLVGWLVDLLVGWLSIFRCFGVV